MLLQQTHKEVYTRTSDCGLGDGEVFGHTRALTAVDKDASVDRLDAACHKQTLLFRNSILINNSTIPLMSIFVY